MISGKDFQLLEPGLVYKVWGGSKLAKLKSLDSPQGNDPLGETWEVSVHKDSPCLLQGNPLSNFLQSSDLPFLIKLIDTSDFLSVQVHPDDAFAKTHENSQGKTECWIVLGSELGCGIYLGMKPGVTKEEFEEGLKYGKAMDEYLVFHEVGVGDFFYVPAGSIHAIGKGVFLAEVQQSSGITYRVWDWNRLDADGNSRELHIEKAMQVIQFGDDFNKEKTFQIQKGILKNGHSKVIEHPQFSLSQVTLKANEKLEITPQELSRAKGILNLNGSKKINGTEVGSYQSLVREGNNNSTIVIEGTEAGSLLLVE